MIAVAQSSSGSLHGYDTDGKVLDSLGWTAPTLCGRQTVAYDRYGNTGTCAYPVKAAVEQVTCPSCKRVLRDRTP